MYQSILLLAILACTCVPALAQRTDTDPKVTVTKREKGGLVQIIATNEEYVPCSVIVTFNLENMEVVEPNNDTLTVPPRSELLLYELRPVKNSRSYGYGYDYQFAHGDVKMRPYDSSYVYELPFAAGESHRVAQGYGGKFSHAGEAALDFTMAEGTAVHAARGGTVVRVIDKWYQHCPEPRCSDYNNVIEILHEDGTYADYAHLKQSGAVVTVGQQVEKGELIGYSGRTGYSSGPHLHFGVYRQSWERHEHLPTLFKVAGSALPMQLEEGQVVSRPNK